jgi:Tfp pilus assembly protein PilE
MKKGITLTDLAIIILIAGILAVFAIPKFKRTVERSKAGEAFNYLESVRSAYEKYHLSHRRYIGNLQELDIKAPIPEHFDIKTPKADNENWSLTLQRKKDDYTVTYNKDGFDINNSNIPAKINPVVQINE